MNQLLALVAAATVPGMWSLSYISSFQSVTRSVGQPMSVEYCRATNVWQCMPSSALTQLVT